MLLTVPQKYLLTLLKEFGALKKVHVERLLELKFPHKSHISEIHQLVVKREILEQDEYYLISNGKIIPEIIKGFDVLTLIANNKTDIIQKGKHPFAVTFFKEKEDKLWRYDICIVKPGFESIVANLIEGKNAKYRVIVFVLENPEQQKNIFVSCEYCFAWIEDGEYKFYKEKR